jgi:hypothetical protein
VGSAGRRPASFCRGASTAGSAGGRRRWALQGAVDGGLCRAAAGELLRGVGRPAERRVSGGGGKGRGRERSWRREKSAHQGRRRASPGRGRSACWRGFVPRANVLSGFGDLGGNGEEEGSQLYISGSLVLVHRINRDQWINGPS